MKLDWYINDANSFELTAFSDEEETTSKVYLNTLGAADRLEPDRYSVRRERSVPNIVGKYTSYITDSFTVSALYGYGEYSRSLHLMTADGRRVRLQRRSQHAQPAARSSSTLGLQVDARPPVPTRVRATSRRTFLEPGQHRASKTRGMSATSSASTPNGELGAHLVRFGYDLDDFESVAGESIEGGRQWRYSTLTIGDEDGFGRQRDATLRRSSNQGATVKVKQRRVLHRGQLEYHREFPVLRPVCAGIVSRT